MSNNACAVRSCKNRSGMGIVLHKFPKNSAKCKQWVEFCDNNLLLKKVDLQNSYHRVCAAHFEGKLYKTAKRRNLYDYAVPTLSTQPMGIKEELGIPSTLTGISSIPSTSRRFADAIEGEYSSPRMNEELAIPPTSTGIYSVGIPSRNFLASRRERSRSSVHSAETQTSSKLTAHTPRSKLKMVQGSNLYLENEAITHPMVNIDSENDSESLDRIFPPNLANFLKTQARLFKLKPNGRGYTKEFYQVCLKLYFGSPAGYKGLTALFILPSKRSISRVTEHFSFSPGINLSLFQVFKMKIDNFRQEDKICCVCFDEISIKSHLFYKIGLQEIIGLEDNGKKKAFRPALNVLVVMVKGIYNNWKQPIAYYYVHNTCEDVDLQGIIVECIRALRELGLVPKVLICDMGASNIGVAGLLNISPENPYFSVDNEQVFFMFDVPHLMRATRNNLLTHSYQFQGKHTSWKYIETLYNRDQTFSTRLCRRLTDSHIHPSAFEKKKVCLATQVLSSSVASGMASFMSLGFLPADCIGTLEFIERFDKLFDILNSSSMSNSKKFNRPYRENDFQVEFLNDTLNFLKEVKVFSKDGKDISRRIKSIKCWQISINALLNLWPFLNSNGFQFLLTRRLSLDALEKFFGAVRQQGGNCVNPTSVQFQNAFKKLCSLNLLNSGSKNCLSDFGTVLTNMQDIPATSLVHSLPVLHNDSVSIVSLKDCDYHFHTREQNSICYICGYLTRKCLSVHTCLDCEKFAKEHQELDDTLYSHYKAYDMPSDNFFFYICSLEKLFQNHFEEYALEKKITSLFYTLFEPLNFNHPCKMFPKNYLLNLFIRMKIFYTLKFANRNFKITNAEGEKEHRKNIIWKHDL